MKISVIVPTYNRPAALELCLMSLSVQSMVPDEVLVADDGSDEQTASVIKKFCLSKHCNYELKHVWQEDIGFRKPMIINRTVRESSGDYLIFIDGDCVAHKHFVKAHVENAEPEAVLGGKRVEFGKKLTERLIQKGKLINKLTFSLLWDSIVSDSRKVDEAFQINSPLLRRILHRDRITDDGIWGCNFSIYRKLFYEINGSDEDFKDGSLEDNDIGIRVLNNGGKVKSVRGKTIVFHLWHQASWNRENDKFLYNMGIFRKRVEMREARCKNGIVKELEQ